MTHFYNPEDPYIQNGLPYSELAGPSPAATRGRMQWDVRPLPNATAVSRELLDSEVIYQPRPVTYKELGALSIMNASDEWYEQGWGPNA